MELIGHVEFDELKERVEALGKTISDDQPGVQEQAETHRRNGVLGFWDFLLERPASRLAVYGGILLLVAIVVDVLALAPASVSNLVYVLAMAVAMKPIATSGLTRFASIENLTSIC